MAALLIAALAVPASAQETATVTAVHGIPGLTVDVWANGEPLIEGFEPGTVTDPLSLPAGSYDIEVYEAGADPESADPAISGVVDIPAGANASLVAHLDADGNPILTPFVNDTSEVAAGEARLTARHTAAAPAVDVLAGGEPVFTGLTNPNGETADLPAGTVSAAVALAGETDPVLGPTDLTLAEGASTIAYAIGSAEEGTLDLLVQTIPDLGSAPNAVDSGTGGQAAPTMPVLAGIALLLGLTGLLASSRRLHRAER